MEPPELDEKNPANGALDPLRREEDEFIPCGTEDWTIELVTTPELVRTVIPADLLPLGSGIRNPTEDELGVMKEELLSAWLSDDPIPTNELCVAGMVS